MANSFFNKEKRIFYINDYITSESLGEISQALIEIQSKDSERSQIEKKFSPKPISVFINSGGGSLEETIGFINLLNMQLAKVNTFCLGYAYSGAFMIFLVGDNRYIAPTASLLYHSLSTRFPELKFGDMENSFDKIKSWQRQIEEYTLRRTNIPKERLDKVRDEKIDWFIDSKEAIELGIATDITFQRDRTKIEYSKKETEKND